MKYINIEEFLRIIYEQEILQCFRQFKILLIAKLLKIENFSFYINIIFILIIFILIIFILIFILTNLDSY